MTWEHPHRKKADSCVKKHLGARNEMIACTWLLNQGYEVFRNVSPFGEVDIIARRGDQLTLIDVKGWHLNVKGYPSATRDKLSAEQVKAGVKRINVFEGGECELVENVIAKGEALVERNCLQCNAIFRPFRQRGRFCSPPCMRKFAKLAKQAAGEFLCQ